MFLRKKKKIIKISKKSKKTKKGRLVVNWIWASISTSIKLTPLKGHVRLLLYQHARRAVSDFLYFARARETKVLSCKVRISLISLRVSRISFGGFITRQLYDFGTGACCLIGLRLIRIFGLQNYTVAERLPACLMMIKMCKNLEDF